MTALIAPRNTRIYIVSQFLYALVFTIPIWIVYYQGRISITQISLLVALQYFFQLIFELPTGALADLVGRRWTVLAGYIGWTLATLLIIGSSGFIPLVAAMLLAGLAEALLSGSLEALLYDSYKQDGNPNGFTSALATNGIIFQLALAAATFSGGFFYQLWSPLPYVLYAVACALAAIISFGFIEPSIDSQKVTVSIYFEQMKMGFREAFKSTRVRFMSLFYIVVSTLTWTNNLYFFDFMLVELQFSDTNRSLIAGMIRILNVSVLRALLGNEKLFNRQRSIYFFPILMTICFLPGIFFEGVWALPFVMGAVMAGTARWIILTRYTNELFESKYRATAISVLSMMIGIAFVFITLISGPIISNFGGVKMMYTILGVFSLVLVVPLSIKVATPRLKAK